MGAILIRPLQRHRLWGTGVPLTAPQVTSVAPSSGSTAGGTAVIVNGSGFQNGATISFQPHGNGGIGGSPATSVVFVNTNTLTCVTPAGMTGLADVVVTNPDTTASGSSGFSKYTYAVVVLPVLASSNFFLGDTLGGTFELPVVLTGTNLGSVTDVQFGGVSALAFTINSPTQITCTPPAGAIGSAPITAINGSGTSNALAYQYWNPQQVTGYRYLWDVRVGITSLGGAPDEITAWVERKTVLPISYFAGGAGTRPYLVANDFGNQPGINTGTNRQVQGPGSAFSYLTGGASFFWVGKTVSPKSTAGFFAVPNSVFADLGGYFGCGMSAGSLAVYMDPVITVQVRGAGLNDGVARLFGWTFTTLSVNTCTAKAYANGAQQGTDLAMNWSNNTGVNGLANTYTGVDGMDGDTAMMLSCDGTISPADHALLLEWSRACFGV